MGQTNKKKSTRNCKSINVIDCNPQYKIPCKFWRRNKEEKVTRSNFKIVSKFKTQPMLPHSTVPVTILPHYYPPHLDNVPELVDGLPLPAPDGAREHLQLQLLLPSGPRRLTSNVLNIYRDYVYYFDNIIEVGSVEEQDFFTNLHNLVYPGGGGGDTAPPPTHVEGEGG